MSAFRKADRPLWVDFGPSKKHAAAQNHAPGTRAELPSVMRWLLTTLLLVVGTATAAELSGIVTEVQDGDTLTLVNWQATYKIRLADIDAPEWKQAYGKDSRASLFHMCGLKLATAETQGEDRYGRTLARMTCAGVDANAEQVRRGMAWVYDRYVTDKTLYAVQEEAKAERRGLWHDDQPMPPWEGRKNNREKGKAL